jgi:hypothetical protein
MIFYMTLNYRNFGKHLLIYVILIFACTEMSCQFESGTNEYEIYARYPKQKIEYKDSVYIILTLNGWTAKGLNPFAGGKTDLGLVDSQIVYSINDVFYSPDKKKLVVWFVQKEVNWDDNEKHKFRPEYGDFLYSMWALIGYRDSTKQAWKLYPFANEIASQAPSIGWCDSVIIQYYFRAMKTHEMFKITQSGERKGHRELYKYGYNLQDSAFWDRCWIWERDTVGSYGLYNFQIDGHYYSGEPCTPDCAEPYNLPKIDYPDSVIKLYR